MADEQTPTVIEALAQVKRHVKAVAKDRQADARQGGYMFRGIEGVLGAVHDPMGDAGIVTVPRDLKVVREPWPHYGSDAWALTRVKIAWTIYGPAGDSIETVNWGEALDNGDKGLGKARSYAQKDLLIRLLELPTSDDDVGDTEATRLEEPRPRPEPEPVVSAEVAAELGERIAALPDEVRDRLRGQWKTTVGLGQNKPGDLSVPASKVAESMIAAFESQTRRAGQAAEASQGPQETSDGPDTAIAAPDAPGPADGDTDGSEKPRLDPAAARETADRLRQVMADAEVAGVAVDELIAEVKGMHHATVDKELKARGHGPAGEHIDQRRLLLTTALVSEVLHPDACRLLDCANQAIEAGMCDDHLPF